MKRNLSRLLVLVLVAMALAACGWGVETNSKEGIDPGVVTAQDLATYLDREGRLPDDYLTKDQARDRGWDPQKGNLWEVVPGAAIGGDRFYNREGLLPPNTYYEADLAYAGGHRGPCRLVYAKGGPYYETRDHYKTFAQVIPRKEVP